MFGLTTRSEDTRPSMSRALLHNTVRIETFKNDGTVHVGTGFFYNFEAADKSSSCPVVVTCWHVIAGSTNGRMYFAQASSNVIARAQEHLTAELTSFENRWIRHPDTNIDLAVLPIGPIIKMLEENRLMLDFAPIDESLIPGESVLRDCGVFQEVKLIGYPVGIWDEKNNLPIVRRGMTASDPVVDYNGRSEFLVDAAVFPGSSGSPVYIAEEGGRVLPVGRAGMTLGGPRINFLGILYAVYEYTSEGKVEIVTIPTAFDFKVKTHTPANLGLVVKASRLNDFKDVLERIRKQQEEIARKLAEPKAASPPSK
jgi:hypothetical protein